LAQIEVRGSSLVVFLCSCKSPQMEDYQAVYETERQDLQRSERVASQLTDVLNALQKKGEELAALNDRILAEARDATYFAQKQDVQERLEESEAAEQDFEALEQEAAEQRSQAEASEALEQERRAAAAESETRTEALEHERCAADARREEASTKARSMVAADMLERVSEEAEDLQKRSEAQENEAGRLRQALMDSWAARSAVDPFAEPTQRPTSSLAELDNVEQELQWLMRMQQECSAELQRMQSLEKQEATLHARLRELSEEKAMLQSARVDLGNAGGTLREAIASQSDKWVRTVDDLEQKRRITDKDRQKLMTECADLQAKLDTIRPELEGVLEVETEHARAQVSRNQLVHESHSLRNVNSALTVMLLGGDSPPLMHGEEGGPVGISDALTRVLQLYKRLKDRSEAQSAEKQKLVERLKELERQAARPDEMPSQKSFAPPSRGGGGAKSAPAASSADALEKAKASATSALKGGLGKLRGFADGVL